MKKVEFGDVVEDDHGGEDDEADEGNLVDALLDLLVEVAAHDAFDDEEENHAAVENGDGQQVEDGEVEGDGGHEPMMGIQPGISTAWCTCVPMPMGPLRLRDGDLTGEHALEDFDDEHELFLLNFQEAATALPRGRCSTLAGGCTGWKPSR